MKRLVLITAMLALAACGRPRTAGEIARSAPVSPLPAGPTYTVEGAVVSADLSHVTINHPAIGQVAPAGETTYRAYADVQAEAPALRPGARIRYSFQMAGAEPVITQIAPL